MSKLILFVCTGNTCRSPMAEYYFNHKVNKVNQDGGGFRFKAVSRGLHAEVGGSIAANARQILLDNDIADISHAPAQVDAEIMREAAFVYGVTQNHANFLSELFPDCAGKIRAMPSYIGDPYGSNLEVYAACFEKIACAVDMIIGELRGMACAE